MKFFTDHSTENIIGSRRHLCARSLARHSPGMQFRSLRSSTQQWGDIDSILFVSPRALSSSGKEPTGGWRDNHLLMLSTPASRNDFQWYREVLFCSLLPQVTCTDRDLVTRVSTPGSVSLPMTGHSIRYSPGADETFEQGSHSRLLLPCQCQNSTGRTTRGSFTGRGQKFGADNNRNNGQIVWSAPRDIRESFSILFKGII